ncbi:MAG: hypothetical protein DRP83_06465 [Planctomycetota bacterium]|nr:MAG: hypothetical protein DRP83_06465 [Planctomycetota bacterium]
MVEATKQRIQSLDRGLQILEYVASQRTPVSLASLAQLLGVEKSSAHRLAQTLAGRGYLKQDDKTLGYELDGRVFALANRLASRRNVREDARKYLRRLAEKTGETAHLAIRGPAGAMLVDHEFGSNPVAVTTRWGSAEPLHCTALGKALLAGMSCGELKEVIGQRLKRHTKNTITRFDDLAEQCRQIELEAIAFDREEFREGMSCMAAPVYDFRRRVVAAIGISSPIERVDKNSIKKLAKAVKECAKNISADLGYQTEEL